MVSPLCEISCIDGRWITFWRGFKRRIRLNHLTRRWYDENRKGHIEISTRCGNGFMFLLPYVLRIGKSIRPEKSKRCLRHQQWRNGYTGRYRYRRSMDNSYARSWRRRPCQDGRRWIPRLLVGTNTPRKYWIYNIFKYTEVRFTNVRASKFA